MISKSFLRGEIRELQIQYGFCNDQNTAKHRNPRGIEESYGINRFHESHYINKSKALWLVMLA